MPGRQKTQNPETADLGNIPAPDPTQLEANPSAGASPAFASIPTSRKNLRLERSDVFTPPRRNPTRAVRKRPQTNWEGAVRTQFAGSEHTDSAATERTSSDICCVKEDDTITACNMPANRSKQATRNGRTGPTTRPDTSERNRVRQVDDRNEMQKGPSPNDRARQGCGSAHRSRSKSVGGRGKQADSGIPSSRRVYQEFLRPRQDEDADSEPESDQDVDEPRAIPSRTMNLGTGDLQALAQLISASERKMSKQFTQGYKTLAEQVKNSNTAFKNLADSFEVMEEKLNSIEKKVFINAQQSPFLPTAGKGRRPQVLKTRTDRVVREEEVLADSPDLFNQICYIFDAPLLSRATAQSISEYMDTCHSEKDTVRNSGRAWAVIMYGLKTNLSRTEFRYGVGKQHANFRFKIATNCLKSAKDLPLSSLRSEYIASKNPTSSSTLQSTQSGISTGNSDSEGPFAWLQGSFVDKKSIRERRKHHELRKSEFRARDGTADRKKAFYIAGHIVKVVIDMLRFSSIHTHQPCIGYM